MKLKVYNQKGKELKDIEVNDAIFGAKVNDKVLAQYAYIYLSNQREGNAHTKDRSEVSGGGKKPWKQKGTGRARAGSIRSPIWRGGGISFGPTNQVNWKRKTTKNFRASAIRNAFSKLVASNMLKMVDDLSIDNSKPLTKQAVDIVNSFENPKKVTIVTAEKKDAVMNAFSNLDKNNVVLINELNAYDLLTGGTILIEEKALDYINDKWSK